MSEIYVFGKNDADNDYSTFGLVGALEATQCTFREVANGESNIELSHPIDEYGKYTALQKGNIIVVPVPVRTTPEIQNGSCVTTVWTSTVKPASQASKALRTLYKKQTGSGAIKVLPGGTEVTIVKQPIDQDARCKVKTKYGTGWVNPSGLSTQTQHLIPDNSQAIEEIQSPWTVTPQYFRIYDKNTTLDGVKVQARHISYDLLYNATRYNSKESVSLGTAISGILDEAVAPHDFEAFTNVSNKRPGLFYRKKNIISAFLDPEEGVCTKFDVALVRDNYSLYFLHDPGLNRGIQVQYRKNMTGIDFTENDEDVATRIYPLGEKENGNDLYLDNEDPVGSYIDVSDVVTGWVNPYPYPHVYYLECEGCKVGDDDEEGGKIDEDKARARMREQAEKLITEDKCYEPKIEMSVDFVTLGDTLEYEEYRNLENCFLWDYILVQHPELGISVTARIVEIEWDCLLDRMNSVQIGSVGKTLTNTGITTWQIPDGFSGGKIASDTVGSSALADGAISTRHIQANSINANMIQAGVIGAEQIAAHSITADQIASHTITAEEIASKTITANQIASGTITAVEIASKTITAEQLISNLITATNGLIANGAIGNAQIADSSITSAKIVSLNADVIDAGTLSVKRLIMKGSNGLIYEINVAASGLTQQQLSEEKYKEKMNGTVIVAKSITADQIAAKSITANEILANTITAAEVDISNLFAAQATINAINAMDISSNNYLKLTVSNAIKDIQIGGSNLLTGTKEFSGEGWRDLTGWNNDGRYDDLLVKHTSTNWIAFYQEIPVSVGETYTLSAYAKRSADSTILFNSEGADKDVTLIEDLIGTSWGRFSLSFTITSEPSGGVTKPKIFLRTGSDLWLAGLKLERGNKATDWSPATSDVESNYGVANMYTGTKDFSGDNWGSNLPKWENDGTYKGFTVKKTSDTWSALTQKVPVTVGETYTFSAYMKRTSGATLFLYASGTGVGEMNITGQVGTDWTRFSITMKVESSPSQDGMLEVAIHSVTGGQTVWMCGMKFERGNKATDWSPAPSDPAQSVKTSSIEIVEDKITLASAETSIVAYTEEGEELEMLNVSSNGVTAQRLNLLEGDIVRSVDGGIFTVGNGGDFATLSDAFSGSEDMDTPSNRIEGFGGKSINGDVVLKLLDAYDPGGVIRGVCGSGRIIIMPVNLLPITAAQNWAGTSSYRWMDGTGTTISVQNGSVAVTVTASGTQRYARMRLAAAGPMGISDKNLVFSATARTNVSTTNAVARIKLYIGDRLIDGNEPYVTNPGTGGRLITGSWHIPADVGYWDTVYVYFYVSETGSVSADRIMYYDGAILELGDAITSGAFSDRCVLNNLQIEGCDAETMLYDIAMLGAPISARRSFVSLARVGLFNSSGVGLSVWQGGAVINQAAGPSTIECYGGGAYISGTYPSGGTDGNVVIKSGSATYNPSAPTPSYRHTVTIFATDSGTYTGSSWENGQQMKQGYSKSSGSSLKSIGAAVFDMSLIPSTANIQKIKVRLKRRAGYGSSGNISVSVRGLSAASFSGSTAPTRYGTAIRADFGQGDIKNVNITDLKSTSMIGIALEVTDSSESSYSGSYSKNFANFIGAGGGDDIKPMLTVTYDEPH